MEDVCSISLSAKTEGLITPMLGFGMGLEHFLINHKNDYFWMLLFSNGLKGFSSFQWVLVGEHVVTF